VSARRTGPAWPYLAVALGAVAGGYLRVVLSLLPATGSSSSWPWITFSVNVAGTFVLAFTVAYLAVRERHASIARPLVGTGFCGALTTFSTLQLEVFRMLRGGHVPLAVCYLGASVLAGYAAFLLASATGRRGVAR
jgi:CrcB protein